MCMCVAQVADAAVTQLLEPFAADVTLHAHNLKRRPLHLKCTPRVWLLLSGQYRTFKSTRCVHPCYRQQ